MARSPRRWRAVAVAALVLGAARPAPALVGATDGAGGLDGSLRSIAAGIDNYDLPAFFAHDADVVSQTLLRLIAAGRPRPWLAYEVHGVQSATYQSATAVAGGTPFTLVPRDVRYRALDASHDWHRREDVAATVFLDRANVRLSRGAVDVTLGRQAITLGKTYFWNPLDVFLPFDPQQFDQEYKPGVDAARVAVALGPFSGVEAIAAAGRTVGVLPAPERHTLDASWTGSAVLGRAFATVRGWDVAVQGGKVFAGYHVGAGAVGELGPLEVRAEAAHHVADDSPPLLPALFPGEALVEDATSAVVGIGRRFASSLTLEAEWFANGAGDAAGREAALLRFTSGATLALSEHLVGVLASYELLPILVGQVAWLVAPEDPSAQVLPRLTWSAADEVEVLAGAIANLGARPVATPRGVRLRSEFGTFPDVYYVEVKYYF